MRTPPGVSERNFKRALEQFEAVIGADWVFTQEEDVLLYRDSYSPWWGEEDEPLPSAAIAPDNVEDVQALVRIAHKYAIPLYTISTGKNLGYGGSAPAMDGSVILDLKRMNRILDVDDRNHTVLVEPGVTFFQLYDYIEENNLNISMDIPDPAWGSVLAHALDHGVGHTYSEYGRDRFSTQCGMEVVLANGEIMRTGTGALTTSKMWEDHQYGIGPWIDGIFSQGNYGIVTKMGLWVRPKHEAFRSGRIMVPKYEDLIPLIDAECEVVNSQVCNGMTHFGSPIMGGGIGYAQNMTEEHRALVPEKGKPDYAALEKYGKEHDIPFWYADLNFHGPEKVIAAQWEHCQDKFAQAIPGAKFEDHGPVVTWPLSDEEKSVMNTPNNAEMVYIGIPSLSRFKTAGSNPRNPFRSGHLYFAPLIPKRGEEVFKAQEVFHDAYEELGIPTRNYYTRVPFCWYPRTFVWLASLPVSRDPAINQKSRKDFVRLVEIAAKYGWTEYRTPTGFQSEVMRAVTDFNDHALMKFLEEIKHAVDPKGILSPGRYGVWPKKWREEKMPINRDRGVV